MFTNGVRASFLGALLLCGIGCSSSPSSSAHLPSLNDITSAPAPIQTAARAVVRIETANEAASGSFISSTGLLLTNNHVLGAPVCPIEGCSIQITFSHQRGAPFQRAQDVFAVPLAVDIGLDVAIVQIYDSAADKSGGMLPTPDFLPIVSHSPASLQGMHVTIVGHPEARLKKWSDGTIFDTYGNWFSSSAYILPGDSGSPVLDDNGAIVGIIHRSPTGEDLVSTEGDDIYSIGTASAPILAVMSAPLPSSMISTAANTDAGAVTDDDLVWLNGRAQNASVDGMSESVLSVLGTACDEALAAANYDSPDALSAALAPCNDAMTWIECRVDESAQDYGTTCPSDTASWVSRFQEVNARWVATNGNTDLAPVSFGIAALSPSVNAGVAAAQQNLVQALTSAGATLDYGAAVYLAAFQVPSYAGVDIATYVRQYKSAPDYPLYAASIAFSTVWLWDNGALDPTDALGILGSLASDPNVSIGTKLYIEEVEYNSGVLQ
jgi:V8-like Glu-specific endopeptidase